MARVNNLVEADAQDKVAVKGNENQSKNSEKFGNIALDAWKDMENDFKCRKGMKLKDSEGSHADKSDIGSLTFDDPYKTGKNDKSSAVQDKKMMGDEDFTRQKKKEAALEDANLIQKKKELAASSKGASVDGGREFSPDKPKVPADGGLKTQTPHNGGSDFEEADFKKSS